VSSNARGIIQCPSATFAKSWKTWSRS